MYSFSVLVVSLALIATCYGSPIFDDLFSGLFARSANTDSQTDPQKESHLVKRHFVEVNRDAVGPKQISLQSLIGDLENSLYHSAASVSQVAHNKDAVVPEVRPAAGAAVFGGSSDAHTASKRHTTVVAAEAEKSTTELVPTAISPVADIASTTAAPQPDDAKIVLQTTEKVPEKDGVPAHILIDRVSVQQHNGGVPLIPAFQVHHTKLVSATIKEPASAEGTTGTTQTITITKTNIKATNAAAVEADDKSEAVAESKDSTSTVAPTAGTTTMAPTSSTTTTQTSTTATTSTTPKKEQLQEAEAELKEKVAEIEAEPVILSARV